MDEPGYGVARLHQLVKILPPQPGVPEAGDGGGELPPQLPVGRQRAYGQLVLRIVVQKGYTGEYAQGLGYLFHHRPLAPGPQDEQVHARSRTLSIPLQPAVKAEFLQSRHALRTGDKIFPKALQYHIGLAYAHIKAQSIQVHARLDAAAYKRIAQIHGRQGGGYAPALVHGAEHILHHVKGGSFPAARHDKAVFPLIELQAAAKKTPHMGRHGQAAGHVRLQQAQPLLGLYSNTGYIHFSKGHIQVPQAQGADLREHQTHVQAEIGPHLPGLRALRQLPLYQLALPFS